MCIQPETHLIGKFETARRCQRTVYKKKHYWGWAFRQILESSEGFRGKI